MSIPDVMAPQLAYQNVKRQSVAATSRVIKNSATNGSSFAPGGTIRFSIGGNQPRSYANLEEAFIKLTVTNSDASACEFDSGSAYSLIQNFSVQTAGSTLSNIQNYNGLMSVIMDQNTGKEHMSNIGHNLFGADHEGQRFVGASIAAGASRTVCLPWLLNGPVASTPQRYWYLGGVDDLQLVIDLEDATTAFFQRLGAPSVFANSSIAITGAELVFSTITLESEAQDMIEASVGGVFRVMCEDYQHASSTLPASTSSLTAPLGFSRSSLNRVLIGHRVAANVNTTKQISLGNRSTAGLTQYNLSIAGQQFPARPVICDAQNSEAMANNLIANHQLKSGHADANLLNNKVGTAGASGAFTLASGKLAEAGTISTAQIGSAFYSLELENMSGVSDRVYSGQDTRGKTVLFEGTYSGAVADAMVVDFWGQSTVSYMMDLNGSRTWISTV